ncbi:MAG: hypothetical protein JRG83_13710 [Deltaproteobacteria bacterium]|nr:hypothetical protein [Deltaproteobacteria bacterium]
MPGIDGPFVLEADDLGEGLNLIVGPNGIGKSSLCRGVEALLWQEANGDGVHATAIFEIEGERWSVERDGPTLRWQCGGAESASPPLPGEHLRSCFFLELRDLLELAPDAGLDLASAIRRQMAGGFDISAPRDELFSPLTPHTKRQARSRLTDRDREISQAQGSQADLLRRENALSEIERKAEEAEEAQRRVVHVERAVALATLRQELADASGELDGLPEVLAGLTGRELDEVAKGEDDLSAKQELRRRGTTRRDDARSAAEGTGLSEPLEAATLETWSARADELRDLSRRHETAVTRRSASEAVLADASVAIGSYKDVPAEIDLETGARLLAFHREANELDQKRIALDERLRLLEGQDPSDDTQRTLDSIRAAVTTLRGWLRVPDPETDDQPPSRPRAPRWVFGLAIALVLVGIGLGAVTDPSFYSLAAAGLGLIAGALLWRPDSTHASAYAAEREAARRNFPGGLAPPDEWTRGPIADRLRDLENELARLEAAAQRAQYQRADRGRLASERDELEEPIAVMNRRRQELAESLHLTEIPPDTDLVDITRALGDLRATRSATVEAAEEEQEIGRKKATVLGELRGFLTSHDEEEPTDAASARAGVAALRDRSNLLRQSQTEETAATKYLEELDGSIQEAERDIAEIYERAHLEGGDRVGLARLVEQLERFGELSHRAAVLGASAERDQQQLIDAGEQSLCTLDATALGAELQRLGREASSVGELRESIAEVGVLVNQAKEGHTVADALADRSVAVTGLHDLRDQELYAAAGRFLLDAVEQEHERTQMPRVLNRARELFGAFTHHAYDLRVAPEDSGSFIAVETRTNNGLRPDQLSDGTRAQLLLASRLAFAEEAEQGGALPLFLDEALDHSDPVRFNEIVRNLAQMITRSERQIFYLTNDPNDIRAINNALSEETPDTANVIDLAAVRGQAASVPDAEALRVEPLPEVIDPSGHTPESYGEAVGVPPFDPARGPEAQHLAHVLWDDLALLHRLLANRLERVGAWRSLSDSGGPLSRAIKEAPGTGRELDDRTELLEAFCEAYCEGRSRPVSRETLENSGAVSPTFFERVVEVNRELGEDPDQLLAALRARSDERLSGYRTRSTDDLEEFLLRDGILDRRPRLSSEEITGRLLASPAAVRLPEGLAAECAHRWWTLSSR